MADDDRGVPRQEQRQDRASDHRRSADDHRPPARDLNVVGLQQGDDGQRSRRHHGRLTPRQPTGVGGRGPVHVLARVDAFDQAASVTGIFERLRDDDSATRSSSLRRSIVSRVGSPASAMTTGSTPTLRAARSRLAAYTADAWLSPERRMARRGAAFGSPPVSCSTRCSSWRRMWEATSRPSSRRALTAAGPPRRRGPLLLVHRRSPTGRRSPRPPRCGAPRQSRTGG